MIVIPYYIKWIHCIETNYYIKTYILDEEEFMRLLRKIGIIISCIGVIFLFIGIYFKYTYKEEVYLIKPQTISN